MNEGKKGLRADKAVSVMGLSMTVRVRGESG